MIKRLAVYSALCLVGPLRAQQAQPARQMPLPTSGPVTLNVDQMPWTAMRTGGEIAFLRVAPGDSATDLVWRVPKGFRAARHWHSADEINVTIRGTFHVRMDDGTQTSAGPGGYSYVPRKMVHEAWCGDEDICIVFTNVNGKWDVYQAADTLPGKPRLRPRPTQ